MPQSGPPLAGRSQGQDYIVANELRQFGATTPATFIPADSNRARFLTLLVANRIAPDTRRDQACRDALRPPWWLVPPQRNVGAKPVSTGLRAFPVAIAVMATPVL